MNEVEQSMEPLCYLRPAAAATPARAWQAWENDGTSEPVYTAAQVLAMGRVPTGWQAVPQELDVAMYAALGFWSQAGTLEQCKASAPQIADEYRRLLAAAPQPPAEQERKPISIQRINELEAEAGLDHYELVRLVEAEHGITHPTGD